MKIIGILGDIGSGKSFVASKFNYPVFNADKVVSLIYKNNYSCFKNLKKKFPKLITKFPISKTELKNIILKRKKNIKILGKIVHPYVQKNLKKFLINKKKNVILDVPLLLENKILKKKNIIYIFIKSNNREVRKRIIKRSSYNRQIYQIIKKNQLSLAYKRKVSKFTIFNDFKESSILKQIKIIKLRLKND